MSGEKKKKFRIRKAVAQVEKEELQSVQKEENLGDYNIWYHKHIGQKKDPFDSAVLSKYRCNIRKHSGWTKGCEKVEPFFCLHFARGRCHRGEKCMYLHRLPTMSDEVRIPLTKDCFGRDKFANLREDMGGVGCFNKESKTLFVQGLKNLPSVDMTAVLIKHFKEWGELLFVRFQSDRCNAYVKYKSRLNAEFAKESMTYQTLEHEEVVIITWADDSEFSNMEKSRSMMENRKMLVSALEKKGLMEKKGYADPQIAAKKSTLEEVEQREMEPEQQLSSEEMKKRAMYQQYYADYYKKYYPQYYKQYEEKVEAQNRVAPSSEDDVKKKEKKKKVPQVSDGEREQLDYYNYLHREYKQNVELNKVAQQEKNERKRKKQDLESEIVDLYPQTSAQFKLEEPPNKRRKLE